MKQKTTSFFLVLILFVSLLPAGITSAASLSPVGGRILYDTGFTGLTLTDETVYAQGAEVGLLDDLRGNVKNDGSFDVTFYGWCIGDITYQPGDRIAMTAEGLVATAVWVRGIFVDPLYTGGDSDGSVAKPYTDVDQAYLALIQAAAYSYGYEAISLYLLSDTEWVVDKYTLSTAYAADDTAILYGNTTYDPETGEPYTIITISASGAPLFPCCLRRPMTISYSNSPILRVPSSYTIIPCPVNLSWTAFPCAWIPNKSPVFFP